MLNERERNLTIIYSLLKTGVVLFIGKVLFDLVRDPGFEMSFWNGFVQALALISLLVVSIVLIALSRSNFNVVGFFLVMLAAGLNVMTALINGSDWLVLPENFLLMVVAFYFMIAAGRGSRHSH